MNHELFEYQGRIGKLQRMLEHDIPRASSVLQNILRQLEAYEIERPPTSMEILKSESNHSQADDLSSKKTNS